jgi:hypothetical protein
MMAGGRPGCRRNERQIPPSSRRLLKQRLSLPQIARVKPFRKPAIDRSKQIACFVPLAPIAPEPCHAHRCTQLPGLWRGSGGRRWTPGDGDVILPSLLISLAFFATFGSNPRIVIRISRAAATITTLTDAARSTSCAGPASERTSGSDGIKPGLPRPDPDGFFDVRDEDFPVADPPGLGGALDRLDGFFDLVVAKHNLDFHLGEKIADIGDAEQLPLRF